MKRRHRYFLNLCSLALLSFSLYLNFVKKEAPDPLLRNGSVNAAPAAINSTDEQTSLIAKTHIQSNAK